VEIINLEDRIAIVADSYTAAHKAREGIRVEWDRASRFDSEIAMQQRARQVRDLAVPGFPWETEGDVEAAFKTAGRIFTAEYRSDYVYHAQLEPLNAVAWYRSDVGMEVWAGTQAPSHCLRAVATATGTDVSNVTLHRMYCGGAFGRRGAADHDYVIDAAVLSKRFGRPVKVIWSREDDVRLGRLKPMSAQYLRAAVDGSGRLSAWHHRVASEETLIQSDPERYEKRGKIPITGILGAEQAVYRIPNRKAEHILQTTSVRVSPLRGVGVTPNKFAGESFLDEIALAQGMDPLALRLQLVASHPRAKTVLETVAEMAEWDRARAHTALGLAFTSYAETMVACIAEISVDASAGSIKVHNLWSAVDPGLLIQPVNAESQIQGGLLFGLSNALKERVTIKNGEIQHSNFHDYPVLRPNEVPDVHVRLIQGGDHPSAVGEVGVLLPAPAIGNAFAKLTGKRLRHMPFTAARVRTLLDTAPSRGERR
jgi:isoquinoline 1-oxidoreductase beta subunit